MADILIKVDTRGDREDGDVLFAAQDKHVFMVNAQNICHRKKQLKNSDGLNTKGTVAEDYYTRTHQYKFTRVGNNVERLDLISGVTDVLGDTPKIIDGKSQHIDVQRFITKALKNENHKIFGTKNNELWYGGKIHHDGLNGLWSDIENKTGNLRSDHSSWPFSDRERTGWLALPVLDFNDKEMERITEPLYATNDVGEFTLDDGGARIVKKFRRAKIDWELRLTDLNITKEDVLNKEKMIDLRGKTAVDQKLIRIKKPNKGGL